VTLLRSAQFSAITLIIAAALGLGLANSGIGPTLFDLRDLHFAVGPLDLSIGHWVKDGLLAIFFFLAAIELKHELRHGELDSARKAFVPVVAAVGGVVVPALLFLVLVPETEMKVGWPIPTATDIAFALGVLAIVGRSLPSRVRALLLALAVIDDLIAILIIAVVFPGELQPVALLIAIPVVLVFGYLSYRIRVRNRVIIIPIMVVLGIAAWVLVAISGIHPTIAGVALGLILATRRGEKVRHVLEPWSNAIVLPLFAFVATLVVIPDLSTAPLGPVFWAIVIALPVGKVIGITGGALLARAISSKREANPIPLGDLLTVAALGGIGFTVSLLMNELAFDDQRAFATEGTLGVLVGSIISMLLGGTVGALRSRWYSRRPDQGASAEV
jgi:Na+:H+ antiporter, NhaA family